MTKTNDQGQMTKSKTMLNTPPKELWVGYFILKGVCHNYLQFRHSS
jgi:hypothetical protein